MLMHVPVAVQASDFNTTAFMSLRAAASPVDQFVCHPNQIDNALYTTKECV